MVGEWGVLARGSQNQRSGEGELWLKETCSEMIRGSGDVTALLGTGFYRSGILCGDTQEKAWWQTLSAHDWAGLGCWKTDNLTHKMSPPDRTRETSLNRDP